MHPPGIANGGGEGPKKGRKDQERSVELPCPEGCQERRNQDIHGVRIKCGAFLVPRSSRRELQPAGRF